MNHTLALLPVLLLASLAAMRAACGGPVSRRDPWSLPASSEQIPAHASDGLSVTLLPWWARFRRGW